MERKHNEELNVPVFHLILLQYLIQKDWHKHAADIVYVRGNIYGLIYEILIGES